MHRKLLLAGLLASGICLAQSDPPLRLGPFHILQKHGGIQALVELPAERNLAAQDFQLIEDGRRTIRATSLSEFRKSSWKAALVLELDVSRSIKPAELDEIKHAAVDFVTGTTDPVALITFADTADISAKFGASREGLTAGISQLRPIGRTTRLYDALDKALGLLETRSGLERQRIVVISDGAEESQAGADSIDGLLDRAQKRRIPIDTVWVPTAAEGARNTLVRASERTDGFHADASSSAEILEALTKVRDRVENSWVVSFDRKVDSSGLLTKEVGISVDRPGISSAIMPLQIPASAPPPNRSWLALFHSTVGFLSDVRTLLSLLGAVLVYITAFFVSPEIGGPRLPNPFSVVVVWFRRKPDQPSDQTPTVAPRPFGDAKRRMTRVEHPGEPAPAQGLALEAVKGPFVGKRIPVEAEHFRIGANPDNDLTITSDDYVSGRHASIEAIDGRWLLVDEGSRNGTFLDGRKLERGPGQVLQPGDSIQVGTSEFRVLLDEDVRAAHASARNGRT